MGKRAAWILLEQQFSLGTAMPGNGVNSHSAARHRRLGDLLLLHGHVCRAVLVTDTG